MPCGGGTQILGRKRIQLAQFGGKECIGPYYKHDEPCNEKPCSSSKVFESKEIAYRDCGKSHTERLSDGHGKGTLIERHPWMTSIQDADGNLWCGGSIATSNRIITAAQCFIDHAKGEKMDKEKIQSFRVVTGTGSPFEFHAQLWRLTPEGFLENKLRRWNNKYSRRLTSFVPRNSSEVYIEIEEVNKVFTLKNIFTKKVGLETKKSPMDASQIWKLSKPDGKGWRTIQNSESGLYLTSKYFKPFAVLTVESKVIDYGRSYDIEDVVLHPKYQREAYQDVAVVKLKTNNAQFWKLSGTKLINKDLQLQNQEQSNINWEIPSPETDGYLKATGSGEVLSIRQKKNCEFGPAVALREKGEKNFQCKPVTDSQIWLRSESSNDGWFTLKSVANGLFLTSIKKNKYKVTADGIDFSATTHPLCLPFEATEDPNFWNEKPVDVLTFATMDLSGSKADTMETIDMFTFTQEDCNEKLEAALAANEACLTRELSRPGGDVNNCNDRFLEKKIDANLPLKYSKNIICAQNPTSNAGTCPGSGGGPVIYKDLSLESPRSVLGAIVHGAFDACSSRLPQIFVDANDPSVYEFLYKEVFGNACHYAGTLNVIHGQCYCKNFVTGSECQQCIEGYWN